MPAEIAVTRAGLLQRFKTLGAISNAFEYIRIQRKFVTEKKKHIQSLIC